MKQRGKPRVARIWISPIGKETVKLKKLLLFELMLLQSQFHEIKLFSTETSRLSLHFVHEKFWKIIDIEFVYYSIEMT